MKCYVATCMLESILLPFQHKTRKKNKFAHSNLLTYYLQNCKKSKANSKECQTTNIVARLARAPKRKKK